MQTILVTNDDGIDSYFLRVLVEALQGAGYATRVAAPLNEQSWISRALSRRREVNLTEYKNLGGLAWAIDGTPTDCVNIALGHLLPEPPAAVVSGINLNTNSGLPHVLGSGTVAGALEGALWNLPALAFSFEIPDGSIEEFRRTHGRVKGAVNVSLLCAASHAAEFVRRRLTQSAPDSSPTVHNINFPLITTPTTPVVRTRVARVRTGALFVRKSAACFTFSHPDNLDVEADHSTDDAVISRGCISHSVLDYGVLGAFKPQDISGGHK